MSKESGRPKKQNALNDYIELRVEASEKTAFKDAADLAGLPMASWARERLRRAAVRELEEASLPIAFLQRRVLK